MPIRFGLEVQTCRYLYRASNDKYCIDRGISKTDIAHDEHICETIVVEIINGVYA